MIELSRTRTGPQDHGFGREFPYAQIGADALRGTTNPVRIPYWADPVPVLGWAERKLSRNVSRESIQIQLALILYHLSTFVLH